MEAVVVIRPLADNLPVIGREIIITQLTWFVLPNLTYLDLTRAT